MRTGVVFLLSSFFLFGIVRCSQDQDADNTDTGSETGESPITVYYGLNESHSRSWAQVTGDGLVGISYFQRFSDSDDEGTLIYKTIRPDGSENNETVTTGRRLEKSVLLFDTLSAPHIFVASSDNSDQVIEHYFKNSNQWQSETIIHFNNEGGRAIYELSADTGPDHAFHLLILKTRSDVDSADFMDAWLDSNLYHLTNATGSWEKEHILNYDMMYTYDMYIKSSIRQDIEVDDQGDVHVVFSEQINATEDPSRLHYATNKTGKWEIETAFDPEAGTRDDAGWFPSLALDRDGIPYISCIYIDRVPTGSATYSKLFLLKRVGPGDWHAAIIADHDDGYYGGDGRDYTGALSHLVFDSQNTPHIVFSDIASTHWPGSQALNVGNIRYGTLEGDAWSFNTIYQQPLPTGFHSATEMHGLVLLISEETSAMHVIGQELITIEEDQYTCTLLNFSLFELWDSSGTLNEIAHGGWNKYI
ncbi:MAG: hypothetical protein QNJ97_12745 [Myxococcota bacterium]|nr:hypothetical protein [Myxococcota bacterium]